MRFRGMMFVLLAVVVLVSLTGCGDIIDALLAPYGYVISDSGAELSGITVTITLNGSSVAAASDTTDANGFFYFPNIDAGTYDIAATDPSTSDAWTFDTLQDVAVTSAGQNLGILRGQKALTLSGTVVNSRLDALTGVSGVGLTITSTADSGIEYTATTGTDGTFSVAIEDKSSFVPGDYEVTGELAGYFIAPKTVSLTTAAAAIGDVQAFSLNAADEYGLSFILVWDATPQDLDLHLSFPTGDPGATNIFDANCTPYFDDFSGPRDQMYWDEKLVNGPYEYPTAGTNAVYMDRDDTNGYGPETMNLIWITQNVARGFASNQDEGTGLTVFGGTALVNYYYYGSAELYVNAFAADTYLTELDQGVAESAHAKVYCIQTDAGGTSATLLGVYTIPEYTTMQSASVLRVLMFKDAGATSEFFMIVPDITVIPDGPSVASGLGSYTFRGLTPSTGIVGVRGKAVK